MKPSLIVLAALAVTPFTSSTALAQPAGTISGNSFNPAISLILDGRYTDYPADKLDFALPGFMLGGEAGLPEHGFSTGHSELSLSANIDDKFYGKFTAAIVEHEDTELELEEAWFETLGLGYGLTIKGGKFFSGLGYLNQQHAHADDFADTPLVYQAMLGGRLADSGLQVRWLAPTAVYLTLGAELLRGTRFPGGEHADGNRGRTLFAKTGGDLGTSSSWQLGLSRYSSEFERREGGDHAHGGAAVDIELRDGETTINVLDVVYKWAPHGNPGERNFKCQAEYFQRDEQGRGHISEGGNTASADYTGEQEGFYVAAIYQFMPKWRVGARFDQLSADNAIANFSNGGIAADEFAEETGLGPAAADPQMTSLMVDYSHSEFSRLRLQISAAKFHDDSEYIYSVQYTMSLGAHGAHRF